METLIEHQNALLENLVYEFSRGLEEEIDWNMKLSAIKGSRGVGKTTILLNFIRRNIKDRKKILYASLDDIYFTENKLIYLARQFHKKGGKHLLLDEVHKYPNWSQELKNIYDTLPQLKVVFTSSSILQILKGNHDLSRRVVMYELPGLSFREFLQIETKKKFPIYSVDDIVNNHETITKDILKKIKPFEFWDDYIKFGYYPFYRESTFAYHQRLMNVINLTLESDLVICKEIDPRYIFKLKRLLHMVAIAVPYTPNVSKLSGDLEVSRPTMNNFFDYLEDGRLVKLLRRDDKAFNVLSKPEKVYLHNTNLMYSIDKTKVNAGNLRETFFFNQVGYKCKISFSDVGDFFVDGTYKFEIGGINKTTYQIKNHKNAFIVSDDMEYGVGHKIPLWLFGFVY
jgi:predicted AAA+ superfamily ATPase